ncbi:MAG: DNA integrity scanning diadenylate cyclase DisA [Streptosporangiales bacterium]|nr:DNA integrity scanning diadenylate cyclase DisA [Streptosporangiales bacterium]MBO0892387.1 DNA integrity scanning diadenylate cyclase DisA [Acidothermales bacterium]
MAKDYGDLLRVTLTAVAPGTSLRDGLERVLRGNTGALIVLGYDRAVESLCTGGFEINVELTGQRLRELAKMDGAIVVDNTHARILRANVHLMPDPSIPTMESGTRHRTAARVSLQTGRPVVSVSQSMRIIQLYVGDRRHVIEQPATILASANQALQTLERYRLRYDEVSRALSALEIEDHVTIRDVCTVVQRLDMVRRIAAEIEGYVVELGTDGRLLALQEGELVTGIEPDRELVVRDYVPGKPDKETAVVLGALEDLGDTEMLDITSVTRAFGFGGGEVLDSTVSPRGYRLLAKLPRLPQVVCDRLVHHFGGLQELLAASVEELQSVDGIGDLRARSIREGLSRIAEVSLVDRFS